ncbi:DUF1871 family protein [Pseudobacillus wudalianchiensis]|uniref:DUF1871 domain-containing protein n=1 Tax=Pseudobacillus wudalianchiensis TaxID=1743143 RepID=A0A1B9AC35_9BACI|nr:DUF1871 family protein [Bacillus wudalianchiensis]OCA81404.1 hypothetical protein A8F95_16780 [Bacillus wudalianchiensis]
MNKDIEKNRAFDRILREWDPFKEGGDFYDTETADAIQAVHQFDNKQVLARKIQEIYEFSFEQPLSLTSCLEVAERLLQIKNNLSCGL